jgi:Transposase DDE domain
VELAIFTNLPPTVTACQVAERYRQRWRIETLFQCVTQNFNSEIKTLAYPKAALFSFAMALCAYNLLAAIRAALGSVHGVAKIQAGLSDFYLADELQGTYRGMMIAIPPAHWQLCQHLPRESFSRILQHLATDVNLKRFLKSHRGAKKTSAADH